MKTSAFFQNLWSAALFSLITIPAMSQSLFSGGAGTEQDPYRITTQADFQALSEKVLSGDNCENVFFRLENDIDFNQSVIDPVGEVFKDFCGTFDGNNHSLLNFSIQGNDGDYGIALFGSVGLSGTLRNITVGGESTVKTSGEANYTAALAGRNQGTIENCTVECDITGYRYVGGIVGSNMGGTVSQCVFTGSVNGQWFTGGITGYLESGGQIILCRNEGTVQGTKHVGGIAGQSDGDEGDGTAISLCCNFGSVRMTGGADSNYERMAGVGGIVGFLYSSTVERCYNAGLVSSNNFEPYAGGIAGNNMDATVTDCFNSGKVQGINSAYAGGIVGINKGEKSIIECCLNVEQISSDLYQGEICPQDDNLGQITNCLFDKQTMGKYSDSYYGELTRILTSGEALYGFGTEKWVFTPGLYPRIKGIDTLQQVMLNSSAVILYADEYGDVFDTPNFVTTDFGLGAAENVTWTSDNACVTIEGLTAKIERSSESDTNVMLTAKLGDIKREIPIVIVADMKGSGTAEDPYLIENANQFRYLSKRISSGDTYEGKFILQTSDFDLGGENNPYQPAGNSSNYFAGNYDGNGKTISGLYINQPNGMYIGLFSRLTATGVVENLTIAADSYVYGSGYVGAIAGNSAGTLRNCANFAEVKGTTNVGGITGATVQDYDNPALPILTQCYNGGNISSERGLVGGIVGSANYLEKLTHCFNFGKVTDLATGRNPGQVGGIAAYATVPVENCYNAGLVSDLSDDETKAMAGGIIGRTYGSEALPVIIRSCLNVGAVSVAAGTSVGAIVGKKAYEGDLYTDCCYDSQVMPPAENDDMGLPTSMLTKAESVPALSADEWVFSATAYPRLKVFEDTQAAKLASAAVFLAETDDYQNVTHNFTFTSDASLIWWTPRSNTLNIDQSGNVTVNAGETDVICPIYVQSGDWIKEISLTVKAGQGTNVDNIKQKYGIYTNGSTLTIVNASGSRLDVYDVSGRKVLSTTINSSDEHISLNSCGTMIVRLSTADETIVKKVILH